MVKLNASLSSKVNVPKPSLVTLYVPLANTILSLSPLAAASSNACLNSAISETSQTTSAGFTVTVLVALVSFPALSVAV